ncbi:hypothetical protein N6H14_14665 [Paenibacillus sp. CC-CFT747]|nr:hypothetical protein N6H14_14665 [Paenibacillus sp. CC-CFT747]
MDICPSCQDAYIHFLSSQELRYNGGKLTVIDFPATKCKCIRTINLNHGVIAELYRDRLNTLGIIGDVSISLNLLLDQHKPGELIECIKKQHELAKKINWLKEKLGLSSNEELFTKALALIFRAVELEEGAMLFMH